MHNRQLKTFARWIQPRRVSTPAGGRGLCGLSDERGQAVVIIALAMIALIAFAGLVFDGGTAYAGHRRMQNAADAGALAGAYKLAYGGPSTTNQNVCDAINDYAITKNGQAQYGGQVTSYTAYYINKDGSIGVQLNCNPGEGPSNNAIGVEVIATTTFNTFFLNVLGMPVGSVSAQAKAIFTPINSIKNNLWPILPKCASENPATFSDCGYQDYDGTSNTIYNLWDACTVNCPGNFGWANWHNTNTTNCPSGSGGSAELCDNLWNPASMQYTNPNNPADNTVSVGDWVQGNPGIRNSTDIDAALDTIIYTPILITVPIWSITNGQGGALLEYKIVAFATFRLIGYLLPEGRGASGGDISACFNQYGTLKVQNGGNCIVGYFVDYANVNNQTGNPCIDPCTEPDTGTRTVTLIPN